MKHLILTFCLLAPCALLQAAPQPNVLIILADDFGWGDMSLHGGKTPTPALDKLFQESVEMTKFMVNPVCSPTRAALLTGRHCLSLRVGPQTGHYIKKDDITLSAAFKAGGYKTGLFGKWDPAEEPHDPEWLAAAKAQKVAIRDTADVKGSLTYGWDESTTFYTGGVNAITRKTYAERVISWWRNDKYAPEDEGFASDLLMRDATHFMRQHKAVPFLCYLPLQLIHGPITPKPEMIAKVDASITDPKQRAYAAYILHLDEVIAQMETFLIEQGLRENTITLFFSDNGATAEGNNLPFRGSKHTIYDGGVRVPAAIRWPAGLKRTGKYDGLLSATDLMPTLAAMCGVKAEKPNYDGKNCWPAIRDNSASPVESTYWAWDTHESLRTADWKLITYHDHAELYDLRNDIGETTDVSAKHPDIVNQLTAMQDTWRTRTDIALSSQSCRKPFANDPPKPEGDVLEIKATQTRAITPKEALTLPISACGHSLLADDWLEFDIKTEPGAIQAGFHLTPTKRGTPNLRKGRDIDQHSRPQTSGPPVKAGAGQWEHRIIGLSAEAPLLLGDAVSIILHRANPGQYHLYIDNLRIRRGDGTFINLWSSSRDTKTTEVKSEAFTEVTVHAVPAH
jgi:arylsulfatase A-like enzyme